MQTQNPVPQINKVRQFNDQLDFNSIYNLGVICVLIMILAMDLLSYNFWQHSKSMAITICYPLAVMVLFGFEVLYKLFTNKNISLIRNYSKIILLPTVLYFSFFTAYPLGYLVTNASSIFVSATSVMRFSALSTFYIVVAGLSYLTDIELEECVVEGRIEKDNDIGFKEH